jgi:hypothetical protein
LSTTPLLVIAFRIARRPSQTFEKDITAPLSTAVELWEDRASLQSQPYELHAFAILLQVPFRGGVFQYSSSYPPVPSLFPTGSAAPSVGLLFIDPYLDNSDLATPSIPSYADTRISEEDTDKGAKRLSDIEPGHQPDNTHLLERLRDFYPFAFYAVL